MKPLEHHEYIQSKKQANLSGRARGSGMSRREEAARRLDDNAFLAPPCSAMQLSDAAIEAPAAPACAPVDPPTASTSSLASPQADQSPRLSRREQVLEAVERGDRASLRQFAAEGPGFEDRQLRRKVWCATVSARASHLRC